MNRFGNLSNWGISWKQRERTWMPSISRRSVWQNWVAAVWMNFLLGEDIIMSLENKWTGGDESFFMYNSLGFYLHLEEKPWVQEMTIKNISLFSVGHQNLIKDKITNSMHFYSFHLPRFLIARPDHARNSLNSRRSIAWSHHPAWWTHSSHDVPICGSGRFCSTSCSTGSRGQRRQCAPRIHTVSTWVSLQPGRIQLQKGHRDETL